MEKANLAFWMTAAGTACWGICFFWMYRISSRRNDLLERLQEQNRRIEQLSKKEHKLIREVHPQVGEINNKMREAADLVTQSPNKS
ncbi:MAG: hypothetical protein ABIQ35_14430 [Verrucomicrobiota bacterium]